MEYRRCYQLISFDVKLLSEKTNAKNQKRETSQLPFNKLQYTKDYFPTKNSSSSFCVLLKVNNPLNS